LSGSVIPAFFFRWVWNYFNVNQCTVLQKVKTTIRSGYNMCMKVICLDIWRNISIFKMFYKYRFRVQWYTWTDPQLHHGMWHRHP
jgi:hypothetical protein